MELHSISGAALCGDAERRTLCLQIGGNTFLTAVSDHELRWNNGLRLSDSQRFTVIVDDDAECPDTADSVTSTETAGSAAGTRSGGGSKRRSFGKKAAKKRESGIIAAITSMDDLQSDSDGETDGVQADWAQTDGLRLRSKAKRAMTLWIDHVD